MDQAECREMSDALTQAARHMAHEAGQRFPHRVRVSTHIKHDVECHTTHPRVVYVGAHAVTAKRILRLMDRILEDARELRLQLHKLPFDPVAQAERLIDESLLEPNGDRINGCPELTCLLCGKRATSRLMLNVKVDVCSSCARTTKKALGGKVRIVRVFRF